VYSLSKHMRAPPNVTLVDDDGGALKLLDVEELSGHGNLVYCG